jgi:DNA adenine methylase
MKQKDVLIKWTGSKRHQADVILDNLPSEIDVYYEPFLGGGSILYSILKSTIQVKSFECSDINNDLIELWKLIQSDSDAIFNEYKKNWPYCNEKYRELRKEFNETRNPATFFCLLRSCRNGLVRYNLKGEFNSSFHIKRNGIDPNNLKPILQEWNELLNKENITFSTKNYIEITTSKNDVIYADPPYSIKVSERSKYYQGAIDLNKVWNWALSQNGGCLLSMDIEFSNLNMRKIEVPAGFHRLNRGKKLTKFHKLYVKN